MESRTLSALKLQCTNCWIARDVENPPDDVFDSDKPPVAVFSFSTEKGLDQEPAEVEPIDITPENEYQH